jgi:uncharacterized membrane protein
MNRFGWRVWAGSIFLGLGLGGFFDGIVLHQVLQWRHMVSAIEPVNTVPGLEINTLGDGLFHLGTYIFIVAGLALLWRERTTQATSPGSHDSPYRGFVHGMGLVQPF